MTEVTRARLDLLEQCAQVQAETGDSELERKLREYSASIPSTVPPKDPDA